jgi:CRISPR type I-E-associated protein CasB/Cse2
MTDLETPEGEVPDAAGTPSVEARAAAWWTGIQRLLPNDGGSNPAADPGALARLRRAATPLEALMEPQTLRLCRALDVNRNDARTLDRVAVLAIVLAHVRESTEGRLGALLGAGDPPRMHPLRLQRLISARDTEETLRGFREAVSLLDGRAPVPDLVRNVLGWLDGRAPERVKARFLFDYHGS